MQAAARVGMKQQAWRVYETDASMPGAKLIVKICGEYGVTSDWLLGLDRGKSAAVTVNGNNNAVGANARVTIRGTSSAPGEMPACSKCPFKKAAKNFQKIFAK